MRRNVLKVLFVFLVMLFVVPVFAESVVTVEKVSGSTENSDVVLNATDAIDVEFNELEQSASYSLTLKNNTDKTIYVHDVVSENLSEEFIDFSLDEKSVNTKIESGKDSSINVVVETLNITHAGRNVDDEITLKILYGNSALNPNTSVSFIILISCICLILFLYLVLNNRFSQFKKISVFIIGGLLISVMSVSANNKYAVVEGKVKYVSQNLLQGSGVTLNGNTLDYSSASKIWEEADKVKNILISDTKEELQEYEEKFDLTVDSSERVVGYFVDNSDEEVPYDLHIQSDGVIYAPVDSTGLFAFPNVESIEGLDYVEFDETTTMTAMFKNNKKLKELDVSVIDTSNVTDTSYMFNGCDELEVSEEDFNLDDTVFKMKMFPKDINTVDFATDDWSTIVLAIKTGKYPYQVGDTKEIDMGSFGTHTVRLANLSTPDECSIEGFSQTACGTVIEFADIITEHVVNDSITNVGGWPATKIRTFVNHDIYNILPVEIKNVIIDTKVISSHGPSESSNFSSTDKLYLLSTKEVWENSTVNIIKFDSSRDNTRQLDYYEKLGVTTNHSSYSAAVKKYNGSSNFGWLRSTSTQLHPHHYYVSENGDWNGYGEWAYCEPNYMHGVSPAFRIG